MKGLRPVPVECWFVVAGLLLVPLVRVADSSAAVHAGFLAAVAALLVVGAWVRRFVLRVEEETPAPAHAVLLGQVALLIYFYARSAIAHLLHAPGVSGGELYLLAAAAGVHLALRRKTAGPPPQAVLAYAAVWLAFWGSALTFLGYRSGRLSPPSSDPDLHALFARLTAEHGYIIYDLLPQRADPVSYPSGFSVLNAIWIDLSRASAVAVVNCQMALQAALLVGLVLELAFALRRGASPVLSLLLIGLAHGVFSFAVDPSAAYLEGTARLSHTALALLPLTFVARLSISTRTGAVPAAFLVSGFCAIWAASINPAHLIVEFPFLLCAAILLGLTLSSAERLAPALAAVAAACALAALLLLSDAWLRRQPSAAPAASQILHWRDAFLAGWRAASGNSWLGVVPFTCTPGAHCPSLASALGRLLARPLVPIAIAALLARLRWTRLTAAAPAARVVVALAAALWLSEFLAPFLDALLGDAAGLHFNLLRIYVRRGLVVADAVLFFTLLAAAVELCSALVETARPVPAPIAGLAGAALLALVCLFQFIRHPDLRGSLREAYVADVENAPESSMGLVLPEDVRLAKAAGALVAPGERVLLPGLVLQMSALEQWSLTLGGARAIPLYSDVPFAFFHTGGPDGPAPADYREHVCERLDLPWLAERGIVWVYESGQVVHWACVHAWKDARGKYFELKLRDGNASLWRLNTALLAEARTDPLLSAQGAR